eukprot:contig_27420_g6747
MWDPGSVDDAVVLRALRHGGGATAEGHAGVNVRRFGVQPGGRVDALQFSFAASAAVRLQPTPSAAVLSCRSLWYA